MPSLSRPIRRVITLALGLALLGALWTTALGSLSSEGTAVPMLTNAVGVPLQLPPKVAVGGMAAALVVALIAGLPPALRVKRLAIVDALAEW